MRLLIVEPYFGTSHRYLIEGLIKRLHCEVELLTLPARKWKWRMRGGAWILAEMAKTIAPCDTLFASEFLDLPAFLALGPQWLQNTLKTIYFHENQLTYPVRVEDERDIHFALTNVETALAADRVAFNSEFHLKEFTGAIDGLLKKFPDYRPEGVVEKILAKSRILPVPLDLSEFTRIETPLFKDGPLTILWNSRWEFDKAPERFFGTLFSLADSGLDFRLAVAGEKFKEYPIIFDEAKERLADKIISWGFIESREDYLALLSRCDIVVSTAVHEFFGIAIAEAVAAGCVPLLPNRLAYPERYPVEFLYDSDDELKGKLREMMSNPPLSRDTDRQMIVMDLDWGKQLERYVEFIGR